MCGMLLIMMQENGFLDLMISNIYSKSRAFLHCSSIFDRSNTALLTTRLVLMQVVPRQGAAPWGILAVRSPICPILSAA